MRLILQRRLHDPASQSLFGTLNAEGTLYETCEREWNDNKPGRSCVPAGFYVLEPHGEEGVTKYWNTFALIGETVDHFGPAQSGVIRLACVAHWAVVGRDLQGCVAIGAGIEWHVGKAALHPDGKAVGRKLLDLLRLIRGPHYITIRDIERDKRDG